jgi:hypothetical protein
MQKFELHLGSGTCTLGDRCARKNTSLLDRCLHLLENMLTELFWVAPEDGS